MFNLTGGKLVIILLVALVVLGPDKLPHAVRNVARLYGELRRMSDGFQSEVRNALEEPMRQARDTVDIATSTLVSNDGGPPAASGTPAPVHSGPAPPDTDLVASSSADETTADRPRTDDESTLNVSHPVPSHPALSAEAFKPETGDPV